MGRYSVAYGGAPAHQSEGARPAGSTQLTPEGARPALSYVPAPGEKPRCVGKLKDKMKSPCPNVATIGPHCAGHARQAEKQQRGK